VSADAGGIATTRTFAGVAIGRWRSGFIAGPAYDALFFIFAPLLGLGLAVLVSTSAGPGAQGEFVDPAVAWFIGVWTYAHLCAVAFRSHLDQAVFVRHRVRFVAVPLLLYVVFAFSTPIRALGFVVAIFWDVYHTSAQNFGFCRIYDAKLGNPPAQGRTLDLWLNHFIYIGPILGGINLIPHLNNLNSLAPLGIHPVHFIATVVRYHTLITQIVIVAAIDYVVFYLYRYWQLRRQGYSVSPQKICLLASTAIASLVAWGTLPTLEAFFVANFFHGLQYFAIVWWSENGNIRRVFGLERPAFPPQLAGLAYLAIVAAMGIGYRYASLASSALLISFPLVISLMHFWYDGFVWSVRRREV
jgi:hypothetical protein